MLVVSQPVTQDKPTKVSPGYLRTFAAPLMGIIFSGHINEG